MRTPLSALYGRRGYVMLVASILMALLAVIGATSLSLAGVDQRISHHNRKHMMLVNTSHAGTEHGRNTLETENPPNEGLDTADTFGLFVTATEAETKYGGISFMTTNQNLGVYWVDAVYQKCANPPPGFSTELGRTHFRSDFWALEAMAHQQDSTYTDMNEAEAETRAVVRKVVMGACKIR